MATPRAVTFRVKEVGFSQGLSSEFSRGQGSLLNGLFLHRPVLFVHFYAVEPVDTLNQWEASTEGGAVN